MVGIFAKYEFTYLTSLVIYFDQSRVVSKKVLFGLNSESFCKLIVAQVVL